GGIGEQRAGDIAPVLRGGDTEFVLRDEVVEEGALGDAGLAAEVVDTGCRPALLPHQLVGGIEQRRAGAAAGGLAGDVAGSGWHVAADHNRPVGMSSTRSLSVQRFHQLRVTVTCTLTVLPSAIFSAFRTATFTGRM